MDKVLKELKAIREEVEARFMAAMERMEAGERRLRAIVDSTADVSGESLRCVADIQSGAIAALRDMAALDNARSAELARQLTVLPLERMDIILDEFERRLETLETRLQKLEDDK